MMGFDNRNFSKNDYQIAAAYITAAVDNIPCCGECENCAYKRVCASITELACNLKYRAQNYEQLK